MKNPAAAHPDNSDPPAPAALGLPKQANTKSEARTAWLQLDTRADCTNVLARSAVSLYRPARRRRAVQPCSI